MSKLQTLLVWLICLWAGAVLAIAFIAAPAAFAVLPTKEFAGAVAAQMFKVEAYGSLLLALFAWIVLRPSYAPDGSKPGARVDWPLWLALMVILFATVTGYFVLTPQMQEVKTLQGSASSAYAQLHGFSMSLYALKAIAWLGLSARLLFKLKP